LKIKYEKLKEGKIIWFSGFNRNRNRKNNFGFIDDPEEEDTFVHKSEVIYDEDLAILDSDSNPNKAKGIIVNYKLKYNEIKNKKDAYQVTLKRVIGFTKSHQSKLKEFYIRSGQVIKYESIRDLNPNSEEDQEKIKDFAKDLSLENFINLTRYLLTEDAYQNILEVLANFIETKKANQDETTINELFTSYPIYLNCSLSYLDYLTDQSLFSIASNSLSSNLHLDCTDEILDRLVEPKKDNIFQIHQLNHSFLSRLAQKIEYWNYLSLDELTYLYFQQKENINQIDSSRFLQVVIDKLRNSQNTVNTQIWETIKPLKEYVEYHGKLWNIAPEYIKVNIIKKRYQKFLQIVEDWKNYKPKDAEAITINCKTAYDFTNSDETLAMEWAEDAQERPSQFTKSTMFSARGAEKAAIFHYETRGYQVKDTAIQQVDGFSEDWKLYDIQVTSSTRTKYIDVKNARSSYSKNNRFSEFCVPTFKKQCNNEDVIILGVFSPYFPNLPVPKRYINSKNIKILGEVTKPLLEQLQERCSKLSPQLEITIKRESKYKKNYLSEYLPIWAFDFDEDFYSERLKIEEQFRNLSSNEIPPLSELKLLRLFPLSLALSSTLSFPSSWKKNLNSSQLRFAEILKFLVDGNNTDTGNEDIKVVKLFHIFLAVLLHFLENCLHPDPNFSPSMYKQILFIDSPYTMGTYDPIGFIANICDVLETVWNKCREELLSFSYFKFDSRGLLRGKEKSTGTYKTILAYCGGWRKNKNKEIIAPCGNEPLYIGCHETCPYCHKLICDQCGFCQENCSRG